MSIVVCRTSLKRRTQVLTSQRSFKLCYLLVGNLVLCFFRKETKESFVLGGVGCVLVPEEITTDSDS